MPPISHHRAWTTLRKSWSHLQDPLALLEILTLLAEGGDWHQGLFHRGERGQREHARDLLMSHLDRSLQACPDARLKLIVADLSPRLITGLPYPTEGLLRLVSAITTHDRHRKPVFPACVALTRAWALRQAAAPLAAPQPEHASKPAAAILAMAISSETVGSPVYVEIVTEMIEQYPERLMAAIRIALAPSHRDRFDTTYAKRSGVHQAVQRAHPGWMTIHDMALFFERDEQWVRMRLPQIPREWRCPIPRPVRYLATAIASVKHHPFRHPTTWKQMSPQERQDLLQYLIDRSPSE